jgi:hypothetical protein
LRIITAAKIHIVVLWFYDAVYGHNAAHTVYTDDHYTPN